MALTSASRVTCLAPAALPTTYVWRLSLNQVGSNWSTSQMLSEVVTQLQRTTTPPALMIHMIIIHQQWASEGHHTHGHPRVDTGNATCLASVLAVPQLHGRSRTHGPATGRGIELLVGVNSWWVLPAPKTPAIPPDKRPKDDRFPARLALGWRVPRWACHFGWEGFL